MKLAQSSDTSHEAAISHLRDAEQERWGSGTESTQGQLSYERRLDQEFHPLTSLLFLFTLCNSFAESVTQASNGFQITLIH